MSHLKTELLAGGTRKTSCSELGTKSDYVSHCDRESLEDAIRNTFGADQERQEHLLIIRPAKEMESVRSAVHVGRKT